MIISKLSSKNISKFFVLTDSTTPILRPCWWERRKLLCLRKKRRRGWMTKICFYQLMEFPGCLKKGFTFLQIIRLIDQRQQNTCKSSKRRRESITGFVETIITMKKRLIFRICRKKTWSLPHGLTTWAQATMNLM